MGSNPVNKPSSIVATGIAPPKIQQIIFRSAPVLNGRYTIVLAEKECRPPVGQVDAGRYVSVLTNEERTCGVLTTDRLLIRSECELGHLYFQALGQPFGFG